jgi:fatty acid desaturase
VTEQLRRAPAARSTSSYTDLAELVRASGLMARCYGYYWRSVGLALLALAGVVGAIVWLGNSWLQLLLAALLGGVLTQFGFLGHDAAHRQMFVSAAWNDWTARILSGAVAGLSYGWWRGKHNLHHAAPNQVGRDPDIAPGVVAFTAEIVAERTGFSGWCARHQGWLFFPLLTLEGINLHIAGFRTLLASCSSSSGWSASSYCCWSCCHPGKRPPSSPSRWLFSGYSSGVPSRPTTPACRSSRALSRSTSCTARC